MFLKGDCQELKVLLCITVPTSEEFVYDRDIALYGESTPCAFGSTPNTF